MRTHSAKKPAEGSDVLIAEEDGRIVGFARLAVVDRDGRRAAVAIRVARPEAN